MRLELVTSGQQTFRVTRTRPVAGQLHITVTQAAVGICVVACRVCDLNIVSIAECWAVTAVAVYGMLTILNMKLKWFQSIVVFKREHEAIQRICVRAARIWKKTGINQEYAIKYTRKCFTEERI